ncbi:MAG: peptidoglycan-binding protein [Clostridia bacterium]|nr:peptidoglycan-binding protein [Clostridia bacterium]
MERNRNMQGNAPNDFERDAIMQIQAYLRHLSFHNADIPTAPLDGIWDSETRESVIAFQVANGLSPTGIVDRETWDKLKEQYDKSAALNSPPIKIDAFPRMPMGYSLKLGEKSFLAVAVQHILDELEVIYRVPTLSSSGVYDEVTATNIREFQARNRIPVTGEVDRETWDALAVQFNLLDVYPKE